MKKQIVLIVALVICSNDDHQHNPIQPAELSGSQIRGIIM